jgi:hypothetical protein
MKVFLLIVAFLIVIGTEVLKVYFIMPFPGSQVDDTLSIAYFIHDNIIYIRIFGCILLLYSLYAVWGKTTLSGKIIIGIVFAFYLFVFMLFNFYFVADKIFYQPENKTFLTKETSKIDPKQLVIGVALGGESKAYPIEIIGYHHQVRDVVGGVPVMITYCTVCRTGRVFNPILAGKEEEFRLVGMDHYNAMFEDKTTKSWWRQVNGEAVKGPMEGKHLQEIPSSQLSLQAWLSQYPNSKIMQPDTLFQQGYDDLKLYDEGTLPSGLEKRDSLSWRDKSWVVGVQIKQQARAYDWNDLLKVRVINDTLGGFPIAVTVENDSASFYVVNRDTLNFRIDVQENVLKDVNTWSTWQWNGVCTSGTLKNVRLKPVQSYQEFWHSWRTFRPHTTKYELPK